MQVRPIPKTGETLPLIGCGTYLGFDLPEGSDRLGAVSEVVDMLLNAGRCMIDSSPMYGRAEATAGDVLAKLGRRDDAFVATKVWTQGRAEGVAQMKRSLALLRTDHVDLMQVHNLVDAEVHLKTLADWKAEGLTRYVGVSHSKSAAFDQVEAVMRQGGIDFVQLNYALADRAAEARLLPLAGDLGIAVIVNIPFGGGTLLRTLSQEPLPPFADEIGCTSWAQLLLKFVLGHPAVTCAIPGTGSPGHMANNLAAAAGDLAQARSRILAWWESR